MAYTLQHYFSHAASLTPAVSYAAAARLLPRMYVNTYHKQPAWVHLVLAKEDNIKRTFFDS